MTAIYYAITDENGVLCVEQVLLSERGVDAATEADVGNLAEHFPDEIYFTVERG